MRQKEYYWEFCSYFRPEHWWQNSAIYGVPPHPPTQIFWNSYEYLYFLSQNGWQFQVEKTYNSYAETKCSAKYINCKWASYLLIPWVCSIKSNSKMPDVYRCFLYLTKCLKGHWIKDQQDKSPSESHFRSFKLKENKIRAQQVKPLLLVSLHQHI